MRKPYDPAMYAGSRWKNSNKGTCPHCGQPISHGLQGNPWNRRVPPCLALDLNRMDPEFQRGRDPG